MQKEVFVVQWSGGAGKTRETAVRRAGVQIGVLSRDLQKAKQECYPLQRHEERVEGSAYTEHWRKNLFYRNVSRE